VEPDDTPELPDVDCDSEFDEDPDADPREEPEADPTEDVPDVLSADATALVPRDVL
jgi:hypothetical protein